MFKYFIIGKYRAYFNKCCSSQWNALEKILNDSRSYRIGQYKIAALKSCLDKDEFQSLNLKHDKTFIEQIKQEGDFLGIISGITDNVAIFNHNINAEYFAASWLAENCRNSQDFLKITIFKEQYNHIRLMFDMLLADNSSAHIAILYRNIDELRKHDDEIDHLDDGGRTTLHLACSHGARYPIVNHFEYKNINYDMIKNIREIDDQYKLILNHLLEKKQDPTRADELFNWNSLNYADKSSFLFPLEIILEKRADTYDISQNLCNLNLENRGDTYDISKNISNLNVFKNYKWSIFHHSALFGYTNLFKMMFQSTSLTSDDALYLLGLAITSDNWKTVNLLLNKVDINSIAVNKMTPLHLAASYGHNQIVTLLLFKDANVNSLDQYSRTPLHLAAANGHIRTVRKLIEAEADIDLVDKYGRSPLHLSVEAGHEQIVELFLNIATHINKVTWNGRSPLHIAVLENHFSIVQLLLDKGADFDTKDGYGTNPIHLAAKNGNVKIMELLLNKSNKIDELTSDGNTSLLLAAENGFPESVNFLLNKDANINLTDGNGRGVLHWAVIGKRLNVVELLLEKGKIDVNVVDNNGRSSLQWAAELGHSNIVSLLLSKGGKAKVNEKASNGSTSLHWAANNGHNDIVKILLDSGADINITDMQGKSPLYWAALEGRCETVQLLLEKNAIQAFISGITALEFARGIRK